MRTVTFREIAKMVADDPLTEAQIRELTGADKDELVDSATAAKMLGIEQCVLYRLKGLPRVHINNRSHHYRLTDVRRYRDQHTY
ncbi:MAG: hypothetical protein IKR81_05270 [Victivallales bacterium]|nr:hypothetical protein [Victivallales bacterium]